MFYSLGNCRFCERQRLKPKESMSNNGTVRTGDNDRIFEKQMGQKLVLSGDPRF
jgi:hypothetical protein